MSPHFENLDLEKWLTEEQRHADHLADVLRTLARFVPEDAMHTIAVMGSQITIGQIVDGALAIHDRRRIDDGTTDEKGRML